MNHLTRIAGPLLFLLLSVSVVRADDDATEQGEQGENVDQQRPTLQTRRHDYSRFSDGPRRVPRTRGRARERARALGLGTLAAARHLLGRAPDARWVEAAGHGQVDALLWPVEGARFGRGFGFVRTTRPDLRHDGVDVAAPEGAVVRAVADGIVAYSDNGIRGFGNCVMIVHPNGWVSIYVHHYRNTVQAGWRVARGERIGFVGKTGIARGPHLHFELHERGRAIDPSPHFTGRPMRDDPRAEVSPVAFAAPPAPTTAAAALPTEAAGSPADGARAHDDVADAGLGREAALAALSRPLDAALAARVEGRVFRNLLWPLRGGELGRRERHGVRLSAERGTAVRAASDGLVVFVGALARREATVVVAHENGWVTAYAGVDEIAVQAGASVRRGEWLGFVGDRGLSFELVDGGRRRDPRPLFVQIPSDT